MLPGETIGSGAAKKCPDCCKILTLDVYSTPAGYYIGTYCDCGPYSRESEYYKTHAEASAVFKQWFDGKGPGARS